MTYLERAKDCAWGYLTEECSMDGYEACEFLGNLKGDRKATVEFIKTCEDSICRPTIRGAKECRESVLSPDGINTLAEVLSFGKYSTEDLSNLFRAESWATLDALFIKSLIPSAVEELVEIHVKYSAGIHRLNKAVEYFQHVLLDDWWFNRLETEWSKAKEDDNVEQDLALKLGYEFIECLRDANVKV